MFKLSSEWDIGEENLIFATVEAGMSWLQDNLHVYDMARDDNQSIAIFIASCFADNLFSWKKLEIVE
jgi:hypothetical protein